MDLRVFVEPQQGATYDDQLRVAQAAEELGFSAFFRSDHLQRIGPGDPGVGPTDSWVTLGGIARETNTIRLGTMVTSATFRLPAMLAIAVAQVDDMSNGRVELGIGTGWYGGEHRSYGIPFPDVRERFDRLVEQVEIIDGLWRATPGETFTYEGEHHQLIDSPALPKPRQHPRPPIILGGSAKTRSAALAARYADEYNAFCDVEEARQRFDRLRTALDTVERDHDTLVLSVTQTTCIGRNADELNRRADAIGDSVDSIRQGGLAGSPAEAVDKLGRFAAIGATRAYLQIMDMHDLDHLALIAQEVAPQL